jgi:hypothetical protein
VRIAVSSGLVATGRVPGVSVVSDPVRSGTPSADGRTLFADIGFSTVSDVDVPPATLTVVKAALDPVSRGGRQGDLWR